VERAKWQGHEDEVNLFFMVMLFCPWKQSEESGLGQAILTNFSLAVCDV